MKILVMGLPGSGKTTLSRELSSVLNAEWINADNIRKIYNDWDFSLEGRVRQANRMKEIADKYIKSKKIVVADFVCPTKKTREDFKADYIIWMNTISEGRFEDTNKMFEKQILSEINFEVKKKDAKKMTIEILKDLKKFKNKK